MDRQWALELMQTRVGQKNLQKHMLAVEAVMRAVAERFGEDKELFGMVGLLHDLDYAETHDQPALHGQRAADELAALGCREDVVAGVRSHSPAITSRRSLLERALQAVDPLTGLIVASALITPSKKISAIDAGFVLNRMSEKSFARGANREQIKGCEEFGLPLEEFVALGVGAMQDIAGELGL